MAERKWMPIESVPQDGTHVDLWRRGQRLCDYRWVKFGDGNEFFEAVDSGYGCVRDATHWMPIPEPPGGDDGC